MKHGVRNALLGLALGAAVFFTPADALAKIKAPPPVAVQIFQKEKDKVENIDKSRIITTPSSSRTVHGLSVEPATTEALVRRLGNAQVIIQGMNHTFDLGRDKGTQLLRQLCDTLNIGAVLLEDFQTPRQDSLTMFCTSGEMNGMVLRVAGTSTPRGPSSDFSLIWLLNEARSVGLDLVALGPDHAQPKYTSPYLWRSIPTYRYVSLADSDMTAAILAQLVLHPGQRLWVQAGAAHVPGLQKLLAQAGIPSASLEVWSPQIPASHYKICKKEAPGDRLMPLLNQNALRCRRHLPRLRDCGPGDFLVDNPKQKLSSLVDFIFYTSERPFDYAAYKARLPESIMEAVETPFSKLRFERESIGWPHQAGKPIPVLFNPFWPDGLPMPPEAQSENR
jgi:hypothetical protein